MLEQQPAIKKAISERGLTIHGFTYDLATGQLKVLEQAGGKASNNIAIHKSVKAFNEECLDLLSDIRYLLA